MTTNRARSAKTSAGALVAAVAAASLLLMQPALGPGAAGPGASAAASELPPFTDCAQLRSWYVEQALPQVTAWGLGGPPVYLAGMESGVVAGRVDAPVLDDTAVPNDATGTNVQERGVDEADLAKTDGEMVVLLDHGELVVLDVTGDEPVAISRWAVPDRSNPQELLLVDERVVLIGSGTGYHPWQMGGDMLFSGRIAPEWQPPEPHTTVITVDLSDPSTPQLVRSERIEGRMIAAREHDGVVRIAVSTEPRLPFVTPSRNRSGPEARAENRRIVASASATDWLPSRRVTTAGGDTTTEPLLDCADVRHPVRPAGVGTLAVLTVDPAAPQESDTTAVTAAGDLLYASTDRLYVATVDHGWSWWGSPAARAGRSRLPHTEIHAFSIDGTDTSYVASGEVAGLVHDRWAFSEYDGLLRVATTRGEVWRPTDNAVSVLREQDGALELVGSVGEMGPGEDIRSVRWFGDVAVLVTFRQTDPLYTVDLSDPSNPRVIGELKIPGFSAYLHPLGDDLLLGVGQDATREGFQTGTQLSTFDLGDLADPRRLDTLAVGHSTYSPVEDDSRMFSYLPEQRLALVPVTSWRRGGTSLAVARIGEDGSLHQVADKQLEAPVATIRSLPLGDGRVALVAGGEVAQLLDLTRY